MPVSAEPVPDDAALRRLVLRALAAVVLAVLAGAVAVLLLRTDEGEGGVRTGDRGRTGAAASEARHPPPGLPVEPYRTERGSALAASADTSGPVTAVLSLEQYLTEAELRAALGGDLLVRALLVAAPGRPPAVVPGRLAGWADQERAAAAAERDELRRLAATADDPEFKAQYEADATLLDQELPRLSPSSPLVYGAVLTGPGTSLRELAGRPGARLVDLVAVGGEEPALDGLIGLRPEEVATTGSPPRRPA